MLSNYSKLANKNFLSEPITDFSKPNSDSLRRTTEDTRNQIDQKTSNKINSITVIFHKKIN